ncbi:MAG: phosphopantetheine-binding protein [Burkholderiales bacterium]
MNTTLETIRQMIAEEFEMDIATIKPESTLESLNIDSLSTIEFMFLVEEKFKIVLSEERVKLQTVGDIATELDKVIVAQHGRPEGAQAAK